MSEVIDRPPTILRQDEEQKTAPPKLYTVEAWGNPAVCRGKLGLTIQEVFSLPMNVAFQLGDAVKAGNRTPVAKGLTLDQAETRAEKATHYFDGLVDGCPCGARAKFIAVPE